MHIYICTCVYIYIHIHIYIYTYNSPFVLSFVALLSDLGYSTRSTADVSIVFVITIWVPLAIPQMCLQAPTLECWGLELCRYLRVSGLEVGSLHTPPVRLL